MVLSSVAESSSVSAMMVRPNGSRFAQRWMEATQSFASTRSPSCHFRPSRRVMRTSLPSFSVVRPSAICGRATNLPSVLNSVSNTI